jgi:hypothetical protein
MKWCIGDRRFCPETLFWRRKDMRTTLAILIGGFVVLAWTGSARSGQEGDARAIVAKAIQAMGGEAKLAKNQAATWKEKGVYYGMGNGLPYTAKCGVQWPGQLFMEVEGVFTIVLNGDKGWTKSQGQTKEMSKEELAVQQQNQKVGWMETLLPLKDKAFTLTALGEVKGDKQAAVAVKVTRKDYPEVMMFFDKTTNLLIKSEYRTKAPELQFKEVTMEISYSNFKDFDGVKMPTRLVIKRDGQMYVEADIEGLNPVGKLDEKVFARP